MAFAGNQKLESLDLSGFGNVTAMYSMCAFCSSLKCVYIDTLSNSKNKTINTYHMFAPCSSLEYLIIDNVNVDFVMQDAADADKGVPASAKSWFPELLWMHIRQTATGNQQLTASCPWRISISSARMAG